MDSLFLPAIIPPLCFEEELDTRGFAVVDGAFSTEFCDGVRNEIDLLEESSLLNTGKNMLTNAAGDGVVMVRPNIFERDLVLEGKIVDEAILDIVPLIATLFRDPNSLFTTTLAGSNSRLHLCNIDTIKVQKNTGNGGCFPIHFDTSTATSKRELTAVLYLNPDWEQGHGGELRVYPFPYASHDIAPLNNRLALFSSHQMPHRVLPSQHTRYVLSIWMQRSSEPESFPRTAIPSAGCPFDEKMLAFLYRPTNRRVLAKLLYAEEWAQSVRESFGVLRI